MRTAGELAPVMLLLNGPGFATPRGWESARHCQYLLLMFTAWVMGQDNGFPDYLESIMEKPLADPPPKEGLF